MFQEDFILRMLRAALAVIQRAMGLKAAGEYQTALEAVDTLLEEWLGLPAGMVDRMDDAGLLDTVSGEDGVDVDPALALAGLFQVRGEILEEQKHPVEAAQAYQRALFLALEAFFAADEDEKPAAIEKVEPVTARLAGAALPADLAFSLFNYYEVRGRFAKAEGVLREMASGADAEWVQEELRLFYTRLLELPESELAAGGLTRAAVEKRLSGS